MRYAAGHDGQSDHGCAGLFGDAFRYLLGKLRLPHDDGDALGLILAISSSMWRGVGSMPGLNSIVPK